MSATSPPVALNIGDLITIIEGAASHGPLIIADVETIVTDGKKLIADVTDAFPHTIPAGAAKLTASQVTFDDPNVARLRTVLNAHAPTPSPGKLSALDGHRVINLVMDLMKHPEFLTLIASLLPQILAKFGIQSA